MRRAPIVLTATAAGVAGVLSFHPQARTRSAAGTAAATTPAMPPTTSEATSTTSASTAGPRSMPKTRTATGAAESNQYGDVQVRVKFSGGRITDVTAVQLPATDPRSQEISASAEPMLRSEALAAQGAQIDGVSGASYTSAGYEASLQSALDKLGVRS